MLTQPYPKTIRRQTNSQPVNLCNSQVGDSKFLKSYSIFVHTNKNITLTPILSTIENVQYCNFTAVHSYSYYILQILNQTFWLDDQSANWLTVSWFYLVTIPSMYVYRPHILSIAHQQQPANSQSTQKQPGKHGEKKQKFNADNLPSSSSMVTSSTTNSYHLPR